MDGNQRPFWLFRWLDDHGVADLGAASRLLSTEKGLASLHDYADRRTDPNPSQSEFSVVAGRGTDLSGQLDCNAPSCRIRQVDDLLRHCWHYFDQVVVADAVSHEVSQHWDSPSADRRKWILGHIQVLLHLRSIGAADLVRFVEKPSPCEVHWQRHADEAELSQAVHEADDFVEELTESAKFTFSESKKGIDFAFIHSSFEHTAWGTIPKAKGVSAKNLRRRAALAVFRRYLAHLTSDVATARRLRLPLGSAVWYHGEILRRVDIGSSAAAVAFQVDLPVLAGVPLPVLLELRRDEYDLFVRFRLALRKAAGERTSLQDRRPDQIAREIRYDIVEPELDRIRSKLNTAEKMLAKKSIVGLTLGSLATTCGLLAGLSPGLAATAGIAGLSTIVGGAAIKDIEERRDASLSDMYFLWKAVEHSHRRADNAAQVV